MKDDGKKGPIASTEPGKASFPPLSELLRKRMCQRGWQSPSPSRNNFRGKPSAPLGTGSSSRLQSQQEIIDHSASASQCCSEKHYLAFPLLDITWKCKENTQANRELTSALYPNLFSLTSLGVCQKRCEVASSRRLQSVCRVGCLQVLLRTQHLLHHTWMLNYVTQNTQNK